MLTVAGRAQPACSVPDMGGVALASKHVLANSSASSTRLCRSPLSHICCGIIMHKYSHLLCKMYPCNAPRHSATGAHRVKILSCPSDLAPLLAVSTPPAWTPRSTLQHLAVLRTKPYQTRRIQMYRLRALLLGAAAIAVANASTCACAASVQQQNAQASVAARSRPPAAPPGL